MALYTEQQIINGCKDKDPIIEEYLYKTYYSDFLTIYARYAKDIQDARLLLNDGFVKVFNSISKYKNQGSFEGWMRRIMVNTCLDYVKSKYIKTTVNVAFDAADFDIEAINQNGAVENLSFNELIRLIQELPPVTRTVFNLHVFEGYAHKQIGKLLNISPNTSYWHLYQAREQLQKTITANCKHYEQK